MKIYNYSHVINGELTNGHPLKAIIRSILNATLGRVPKRIHLASVERMMKLSNGDYLINYWGAWGRRECIRKECFDRTTPVLIRGKEYPAPIQYDAWLTSVYGDYMTPPSSPPRYHGRAYWKRTRY